jgi:hypothetical protein
MQALSPDSDLVAAARSGWRADGARYRGALALCLGAVLGLGAAAASALTPPGETLLPLGLAEVSELQGEAWAVAPAPRRPLHVGDRIGDGQQVLTSDQARLELRFLDGSLLRVGGGSALTLLPQLRRVALHRGRVLVAADRMLGGLGILLRQAVLLPEGTTYVAAVAESSAELTVLEGAVCACSVAPTAVRLANPGTPAAAATTTPRPPAPPPGATLPPTREQMVLPGESITVGAAGPGDPGLPKGQHPHAIGLADLVKTEPLITSFTRPLPALRQITELADQQRRSVLAGRNERLRREIFWKRKPRAPVKLPALFNEPDSVIIKYYYPE